MDLFSVRAVQPLWDAENFRHKKRKLSSKNPPSKRQENKVLELVLERMNDLPHITNSSLLATASAPNVVMAFLPIPKKEVKDSLHKETRLVSSVPSKKEYWPIGIIRCEYNRWVNALMQFLLCIPSLSEMFAYTPKSLSPFIDFIDLYRKEQRQGKSVTTANPIKILEALRKKSQFGFFLNKEPFQLFFDVLQFLMQNVLSKNELSYEIEGADLIALHPEWIISLDEEKLGSWEENIESSLHKEGLDLFPKELLVFLGVSNSESSLLAKKQFFLSRNHIPSALYEMNAFVEFRPDRDKGDYLTYVKVEGEWLQCDDNRIIQLRSGNLPIALRRSFLFHYKKIK